MLRRWTYFQPLSANSLRPATEKRFKFVLSIISTPAGNANLEKKEKNRFYHFHVPLIIGARLRFGPRNILSPAVWTSFPDRSPVWPRLRQDFVSVHLSGGGHSTWVDQSITKSVWIVDDPECLLSFSEVHTTIHDLNQSIYLMSQAYPRMITNICCEFGWNPQSCIQIRPIFLRLLGTEVKLQLKRHTPSTKKSSTGYWDACCEAVLNWTTECILLLFWQC